MINHKFSVIIIAYNNKTELQSTLGSINNLTYSRDDFEVIVVDDGSMPTLEPLMPHVYNYKIRFHYIPRTSSSCRAKARNQGAGLASHPYLVFIDGDQYINSCLLKTYDECLFLNPGASVILGTRVDLSQWQSQLLLESNNLDRLEKIILKKRDVRLRVNEAFNHQLMNMPGAWTLLWSHNFYIRKDLFEHIGGFDEKFISWGFEDVELGYRLMKNKVVFTLIENNVFNLFQENRYTPEKHYEWLNNIEYFYQKYNDIGIMHQLGFYESFAVAGTDADAEFKSVLDGFTRFNNKIDFLNRMRVIR